MSTSVRDDASPWRSSRARRATRSTSASWIASTAYTRSTLAACGGDFLAGRDGAGEHAVVDAAVDERCARGAATGHDLEQIGRQVRGEVQLARLQRDQRRDLGWLQHDTVAGDQRHHRLAE